MASASTPAPSSVVVWEWSDGPGHWRPYEPQVASYIEQNYGVSNSLNLGNADPNLQLYSVDLLNLYQMRYGIGSKRPVRRQIYNSDSPAAKGIVWQWLADYPQTWQPYDMDIACFLEDAYTKNFNIVDLSQTHHLLPYTINLINMTQTRNETHRVRQIQRVALSHPYPMCVGATPQNLTMSTESSLYGNNISVTQNTNTGVAANASTGKVLPGKHSRSNDSSPEKGASNVGSKKKALSTAGASKVQTRQAVRTSFVNSSAASYSSAVPQSSSFGNIYSNIMTNGFTVNSASSSSLTAGTSSMPVVYSGGQTVNGSLPGSAVTSNPAFSFGMLNPAVSVMISSNTAPQTSSQPQHIPSTGSALKPLRGSRSNQARASRANKKTSKKSSRAAKKEPSTDEVLQRYVTAVEDPAQDEDCCICCDSLRSASGYNEECNVVYKLNVCSHMFHRSCLSAMYESGNKDGGLQCPTCKVIYGQKFGNCPPGMMQYDSLPNPLPGHPDCGAIRIVYSVSSGIQGPEHPHPGCRYAVHGFPRHCYLPDTEKGRKVLRLLLVAWERRLTFTVGNSVTTGAKDTVVWNEIHHKTEFGSNHSGHGYPDPNYLDNVLMELSLQGITDADDNGEI